MSSERDRYEQSPRFAGAEVLMEKARAEQKVREALERVLPADPSRREAIHRQLMERFPDDASPGNFWHAASSQAFRDFFVWGHDYDWGTGLSRKGAMGPRHVEIASECLERGFLPEDLHGKKVLDIGCWSGGDLLLLRGLGADVEAIEEHRRSAESARGLCQMLDVPTSISTASVYSEREDWRQQYDVIYCSGVIYHVTDPLLFLRICFAYLRVGGRLIIETKALAGESKGSLCGYSGTVEKGWNWFSPNWDALGRWLVDAGFAADEVRLYQRWNGRLLGMGVKTKPTAMIETAGFSRPGSWLEGVV